LCNPLTYLINFRDVGKIMAAIFFSFGEKILTFNIPRILCLQGKEAVVFAITEDTYAGVIAWMHLRGKKNDWCTHYHAR
jgi:hypothetical protein